MSRMVLIAGTLIEPGDTREVHLSLSEGANSRPVLLPITVVRGASEGPTLCLTAAVHGNELNGTAILRELMTRVKPAKLKGTLIIVPLVNMFGFLAQSRYLPDRRDLNRFFPGKPFGNLAERIAHRFFEDVIRKADYLIDLHTAPFGRENFPHVRADMRHPEARKLARAFGSTVIVNDVGKRGMLRRAATQAGIPSVVYEGGTADRFERIIVRAGLHGIETFLTRMGMTKRKVYRRRSPFRIIVQKSQWLRAERGGLLELKTRPGGLLYRGDPVAAISNPLGREFHVVHSPVTGLVIGVNSSPLANPGTPIAHIVELRKTLATVERAVSKGEIKAIKV